MVARRRRRAPSRDCREVADAERLFWGAQGKILRLKQPQIDISSTAVREHTVQVFSLPVVGSF